MAACTFSVHVQTHEGVDGAVHVPPELAMAWSPLVPSDPELAGVRADRGSVVMPVKSVNAGPLAMCLVVETET